MFEYQHVGELMGVKPERRLLLPTDRPLSYLRVEAADPEGLDRSTGLTRALLEQRASEFRIRIPFLVERGGRLRIAEALDRFAVSRVFPVLDGRHSENGGEVDICWLDWVQMGAVGRDLGAGVGAGRGAVSIAGLELTHTYMRVAPEENEPVDRSWQYWNSRWEFAAPPPERADWWRVQPNESRNRPSSSLRRSEAGFGPQARGTFAACLHREMREALGNPRYVVIRHPYREGWLPVQVLDFDNPKAGEEVWRKTIFLDRTARDALGIADGEFCFVYPWLHPRRSIWWRAFRDRAVGSRMIAAHVRAPARADLEKPVCRLEPAALEAIGGRPGEFVVIEHVAPPEDEEPSSTWRRVHTSQRILPIDSAERAERERWEAAQLWDDSSNPRDNEGREALRLEGYIDCAERLGVHPPYPTIYLNYYARQRLQGLGLCQPVQARVSVPGRLLSEAGEFAWLAVIALLGAVIAFVDLTVAQAAAAVLLVMLSFALVFFRAIRAIR